jgi:hypothetical protein
VNASPRPPWRAGFGAAALAVLCACGGGGGGGGGGPLTITSTTANDGVIGASYNNTVATSGGRGTKTFSISGGALPAGLSLSAAGAITGTPAGPVGTSNFTVSVTDSAQNPATDTQALSIDIVQPLAVTTAAVPGTSIGDDYGVSIDVTGGTTPYAYSLAGSVPSGLAIDSSGALTGTIAADAITGTFDVVVTDSSSPALTAERTYKIAVTLEVATTALADATGGVAYSDTVQARGGLPPYAWTLIAGTLPAGLTGPSAAGTISGTPVAACDPANANLSFQVTDSDTPPASAISGGIDLTVVPATLAINTAALPNAVINAAYDQTIAASGGVPPYSFAITTGNLPNGLALAAGTGRITGTPDTIGTQAFTVEVTDSCPAANTDTQALSITVSTVLGRNDSIATATILPGNGSYAASISPSGHPNIVLDPDEDYYAITTGAASTVTVDINAVDNGSPLDSVIELLAANGAQLNTCVAPAFTSACEHDDDDTASGQLDSFLQAQVPAGTTIYIHVVDWGSNARPDKLYDLVISGVN